jgi:hypothetical protein
MLQASSLQAFLEAILDALHFPLLTLGRQSAEAQRLGVGRGPSLPRQQQLQHAPLRRRARGFHGEEEGMISLGLLFVLQSKNRLLLSPQEVPVFHGIFDKGPGGAVPVVTALAAEEVEQVAVRGHPQERPQGGPGGVVTGRVPHVGHERVVGGRLPEVGIDVRSYSLQPVQQRLEVRPAEVGGGIGAISTRRR